MALHVTDSDENISILEKVAEVMDYYVKKLGKTCLDKCPTKYLVDLLPEKNRNKDQGYGSRKAFKYPQEMDTVDRYIEYNVRFVFFLVRIHIQGRHDIFHIRDFSSLRNLVNALNVGDEEQQLDCLHQVMCTFLLQRLNVIPDKEVPVFQFILLSHMTSEGTHMAPNEITRNLAALKFLVKCVFLIDCFKDGYPTVDVLSEKICLATETSTIKYNTPYYIICQEMGGMSKAVFDQDKKPKVMWSICSKTNSMNYNIACIGSCKLSVYDIQRLAENLIAKCERDQSYFKQEFGFCWNWIPTTCGDATRVHVHLAT